MICTEMQTIADAYVDRELDLMRSIEVERHLHDCLACQQLHTSRMTIRKMIRVTSFRYRAPASLEESVRAMLAQQNREKPKFRWLWFWSPPLATTAAALALFGFFSLRTGSDTIEREVLESHIRSMMAGHLMDVPSTDRHIVKPWFQGKLDFSPPVEDYSADGFPLIGGRLDYLHGHPAAALVFRRNQHIINVFVWPVTRKNRGFRSVTRQGYHLIETIHDGMECWLISDLNDVELQEFAVRLTK